MSAQIDRIVDLDEVDSTSDHARTLLNQKRCELPFVVRARRQTAGRGRGDHRWWSDEGSLTFTVAIDPRAEGLPPTHEPRLALAVAEGIVSLLELWAPEIPFSLRWPNDLESRGKKFGGILPERVETSEGVRILLGIGLNVSTQLVHAPDEVQRMATTLEELGFVEMGMDAVFTQVLAAIPPAVHRLAANDPEQARRWSHLDSLRGQRIRLRVGDQITCGVGNGISTDGGLIVGGDQGQLTFYGGQVLR